MDMREMTVLVHVPAIPKMKDVDDRYRPQRLDGSTFKKQSPDRKKSWGWFGHLWGKRTKYGFMYGYAPDKYSHPYRFNDGWPVKKISPEWVENRAPE
ncbi:hypothetical protein TWF569_000076 [Orbilia oligospora]|uniref:Uncharacterized protein n=1 Tax=Orbilia oligospora TaxID=2813651 RepID=A0A7C8IXS6_ORBOL|nr:hypothetical protein TWF102_002107 [Orbilia oligospora]KAF3157499.1 hypothetical protein TWF569_000076 [Orbilia oligospora]